MSKNSSSMNEVWGHYSFSPRISIGAKWVRVQENEVDSYSAFPQLSLLLWRWNHEKFQANIYSYGGFGGNWANNKNGWSAYYGAEADIEDRRLYFSTSFEHLRQSEFRDLHSYRARGGVAPYVASFEEPASWVIVQYDYKPAASQEHHITPLLRLFYKNVLTEMGSSLKGDWQFNFMTHF